MTSKIINLLPFCDNYIAVAASNLFFRSDAGLVSSMLFQGRYKAQYDTTYYPEFHMIQGFLEYIRRFNPQYIDLDLLTLNLFWKHSKDLNIIFPLRRPVAQRLHYLFDAREFMPHEQLAFPRRLRLLQSIIRRIAYVRVPEGRVKRYR